MAPQNPLTTHGNDKTMNLNHLILTNIQSSPYFKVNLYELKTYHEVIDEIYFKVGHMEPWEKGSRKTAGQTGMCGGVRGVGAGGIVSSAYCLLYKLFTLKLTKKQVIGLITHVDSPYIRGLGFMFIRYTQPPGDLWDWYVDYLDDEEEIDVKAGGGHTISMGEMVRQFLTKLEWYSTLFPRIPVPIQKDIQRKMQQWEREHGVPAVTAKPVEEPEPEEEVVDPSGFGEAERVSHSRASPKKGKEAGRSSPPFDITKEIDREKDREKDKQRDSKDKDRHKHRDSRDKERHGRGEAAASRDNNERHRDSDRHRDRGHREHKKRSRSRDRRRSRSPRDRKERAHRSRSPRERRRSRSRDRKEKERVSPSKSRDHHKKSSHRDRERREPVESYERDYHKKSDRDRYEREDSYERDLRREKARQKSEKNGH